MRRPLSRAIAELRLSCAARGQWQSSESKADSYASSPSRTMESEYGITVVHDLRKVGRLRGSSLLRRVPGWRLEGPLPLGMQLLHGQAGYGANRPTLSTADGFGP